MAEPRYCNSNAIFLLIFRFLDRCSKSEVKSISGTVDNNRNIFLWAISHIMHNKLSDQFSDVLQKCMYILNSIDIRI